MKEKIIEILIPVVCSKGYADMTFSCMAAATGLKKSSLYHFFPEGKAQIGVEIFLYVEKMLGAQFLSVLESEASPLEKFHTALDLLSTFYQMGNRSCLLDVCTINSNNQKIQEASRTILTGLLDTFTDIFAPCFSKKEEAREKAIEVISSIQGSLILSRVTGQTIFFSNCIHNLKITFRSKFLNETYNTKKCLAM